MSQKSKVIELYFVSVVQKSYEKFLNYMKMLQSANKIRCMLK